MKFVLTLAAALALPAASFSQEFQYPYPDYAEQISARYRTDINDFPSLLVEAFVLAHDKRFYDRPAWKSEVTDLLGKQFLPASSSKINRRLEVMAMSIEIGKIHTHEAILAALLDSIFFGHQCYGAHDAALGLYGRPLS
ncbi:transglycosylase domain-containing protein [Halovulum sp. GXIMD14793]